MNVVVMSNEQAESEVEGWMYPYIAGALDFRSGVNVNIIKAPSYKLGYTVNVTIEFTHRAQTPLGMIDMFCEQYDIKTVMNEHESGRYRLQITGRENVKQLLEELGPFIVGSVEQFELIMDHILPALERGEHRDRQKFVNLMHYIDKFSETTAGRSSKYTKEFFEEEWSQYL